MFMSAWNVPELCEARSEIHASRGRLAEVAVAVVEVGG